MKRVGIIGAGNIGRWHAQRWGQLPVTLVGYYDARPEASAATAERSGGCVFENMEALIEAVDIIDVCTPTCFHREPVVAAARAGRDIVCEKPLARSLEDAEAMIAACHASESRLFVAQVVRFFPQFAQAKALLAEGEIGRPVMLRSVRGGSAPEAGRSWFSDFNQSGGAVMDLGVHDIDFARWCLGDVERVFARGLCFADSGAKDHALLVLRFWNGAIAHIECSWAYPPGGFHTRFEIAGTRGVIEFDSRASPPVALAYGVGGATGSSSELASPVADRDDPYYLELNHFLRCVDTGEPFLVTAQDGLEAVRVALAAIESMRRRAPVALDDFALPTAHSGAQR